MRYLSYDGKVFDTEEACCEYEQREELKRKQQEKQEERYSNIKKHYNMLIKEICSYEEDYNKDLFSILFNDIQLQYMRFINGLN